MNQLSLAYQRHSDTSSEAAHMISEYANTLRAKVLLYLRAHPEGLTDEQMQNDIPMPPSTQRPRRCELVDHGLVIDSGTRRKTASGRSAVVWKAK